MLILLQIPGFPKQPFSDMLQFQPFISEMYVLGIILTGIFIALSLLISNLISSETGANPRDPSKRRIWFFVLGILAFIANFGIHYFNTKSFVSVNKVMIMDELIKNMIYSSIMVLVLYGLIGLVISKVFKSTKYGTIFPSN